MISEISGIKVQDVGSNPAGARNQNQTLGTPLQKVAQWSGQNLSGRPARGTRPEENGTTKNKEVKNMALNCIFL